VKIVRTATKQVLFLVVLLLSLAVVVAIVSRQLAKARREGCPPSPAPAAAPAESP